MVLVLPPCKSFAMEVAKVVLISRKFRVVCYLTRRRRDEHVHLPPACCRRNTLLPKQPSAGSSLLEFRSFRAQLRAASQPDFGQCLVKSPRKIRESWWTFPTLELESCDFRAGAANVYFVYCFRTKKLRLSSWSCGSLLRCCFRAEKLRLSSRDCRRSRLRARNFRKPLHELIRKAGSWN